MVQEERLGHVMVDLETLGTTPGSVILSAALVEFSPITGKTGMQWYCNVDLDDSMKKGFRIDASTLKWWMIQDQEARNKAFMNGGISAGDFINNITAFFNSTRLNGVTPCIWSNGAGFDIQLIRAYYSRTNFEIPWRYVMERCVRTMVGESKIGQIPFEGTKHDPVADCYHQIKQVHLAYQNLGLAPKVLHGV